MRGMRRINKDAPVHGKDEERAEIASHVQAFLANGGKIEQVGLEATKLINGIRPNLLSGNLGDLRGR